MNDHEIPALAHDFETNKIFANPGAVQSGLCVKSDTIHQISKEADIKIIGTSDNIAARSDAPTLAAKETKNERIYCSVNFFVSSRCAGRPQTVQLGLRPYRNRAPYRAWVWGAAVAGVAIGTALAAAAAGHSLGNQYLLYPDSARLPSGFYPPLA